MNRILPIPAVLDVAVFRGSHFLSHFIFGWMKGAQVRATSELATPGSFNMCDMLYGFVDQFEPEFWIVCIV